MIETAGRCRSGRTALDTMERALLSRASIGDLEIKSIYFTGTPHMQAVSTHHVGINLYSSLIGVYQTGSLSFVFSLGAPYSSERVYSSFLSFFKSHLFDLRNPLYGVDLLDMRHRLILFPNENHSRRSHPRLPTYSISFVVQPANIVPLVIFPSQPQNPARLVGVVVS